MHESRTWQDQQKLFSTIATHPIVGSNHALEDRAGLFQYLVACGVTERIVDPLEVIQVGQDDAHRQALAARSVDLDPQTLNDDAVIPESRQVIVLGVMAHLLL